MKLELLSTIIKIIPETFLEEEYLRNFTLTMSYGEFQVEETHSHNPNLDKVLSLNIPKNI